MKNELTFPQNSEGLVLGCIEAKAIESSALASSSTPSLCQTMFILSIILSIILIG